MGRGRAAAPPVQEDPSTSKSTLDEPLADEAQLRAIRKLRLALGREEPGEPLTFAGASALIRQLNQSYNDSQRKKRVG